MSLLDAYRFLFKKKLREYTGAAFNKEALEMFDCYAIVNAQKLRLTGKEVIVCLAPPTLCIIDQDALPETISIIYTYQDRIIATLGCKKINKTKPDDLSAQLFTVHKTTFKQARFILYLYYFRICHDKLNYSFNAYLNLAGMFCYPRKVVLVSVKCDAFISIFPMDLHLCQLSTHTVFLGLRKSNITNTFIENKNLKVSVADFSASRKEAAYAFGKFHSSAFPAPDTLPYRFISTEEQGNLFPDFIDSYRELALSSCIDLGLQNLLVFEIKNSVTLQHAQASALYHLHYLAGHE